MIVSRYSTIRLAKGALTLVAFTLVAILGLVTRAGAHFSYSDPRVIHVAEHRDGHSVILIRMPAPLALLPGDWKGRSEMRTPPFARVSDEDILLNIEAIASHDDTLREKLDEAVTLWVGGQRQKTRTEQFRFWADDARPGFGTLKSALAAFDLPYNQHDKPTLSYYELTLDVMISVPIANLSEELRLESDLGHRFQVIEKLGTVVKLHRNDVTETRATMGTLDVSFPRIASRWDILFEAALTGAEHIYRGLDHLALVILIAITALHVRQALEWASAFTCGHIITLVGGLYGYAPSSSWFVPVVEFAIVLSIVYACVAVFLRCDRAFGWLSLLIVGLIHGYGFAASASDALFADQFDPLILVSFAVGLELCQFAIYAVALPMIVAADRTAPRFCGAWRRAVAFGIALFAISVAVSRLADASRAFAVT